MARLRPRSRALLALTGLGAALLAVPALATTPSSLTVPQTAGGTASATFDGTVPPSANPTSSCADLDGTPSSANTVDVVVPANSYTTVTTTATFAVTWTPVGQAQSSDEVLTVTGPDGQVVGDSDTSGTTETVTAQDPVAGRYTMTVCGYTNAQNQPYTGTVTLASASRVGGGTPTSPTLPLVDDRGLGFGATLAADIQRDESEPNMEIDRNGLIYTCGPTGFSNASDYAQVSTDGGDQFHLLGTPPRGQQGTGGGGDCGLATSAYKNAKGNYTYSYTGLGPLTGFTTSSSDDNGRTLQNGGPQGNTDSGSGVLTDRQWQVFTDPDTVLLSYNQQMPRNVVVQRSDDGGVTYGVNGRVAAPNPLFPGPMRILEKELNPTPGATQPLVYFPWNNSANDVNLSISPDGGTTWTTCTAGRSEKGSPSAGFMTADNDTAGNIYLSYTDDVTYQTFLTVLPHDKISGCDTPVEETNPVAPGAQPTKNPGFSTPVRVNRGNVKTTVFPWLVAGGAPGRVAIAYYGTETPGDPNVGTFKATWDVYVSQSLDALSSAGPSFGQVKATTHPFHYDSICLNGLGCSLDMPEGDRSLGDFFALDYSPKTGKLSIVYDQGAKKPGEGAGLVATPAVLTQNAGPSNGGPSFDFPATPARPALRQSSVDPAGDALSAYSALVPPGTTNTTPPANEPAADVLSAAVGPQRDATGAVVPGGGFSVTMKMADLSDDALTQAMTDTQSSQLLWLWRFTNGFQASAASARYDAARGFTFGYNDYTVGNCLAAASDECQVYPGGTSIVGSVDRTAGTITLNVPRALLRGLKGSTGPGQRPVVDQAVVGTRFYDAAAYTVGSATPEQSQSYLYPLDNSPAMDFLLPDATVAASPSASASASAGSGGSPAPGSSASPSPSASRSPSPSSSPSAGGVPPVPGNPTSGLYHPLVPARLLDTRTEAKPVVGGVDRLLTVTGAGGVPSTGVSAVVLNVVSVRGSSAGDLSVFPAGSKPSPRTAVLAYRRSQTVPVLVTVGVGDGGRVGLSVNSGSADLVVDVAGWYGTTNDGGLRYTALRPDRALDTRTTSTPLRGQVDRVVPLAGRSGVPAGAKAVVLNATVTGASASADLQLFPTGQRPPSRTSNLNVVKGQTVANAVVATLGSDGSVSLNLSQGSAQVVLDVLGYYADTTGGRLVPLAPQRVLDTRTNRTPVQAGNDRVLRLAGAGGVPPAGATAAVLSVTALGATRPMDLQVYPTGNAPVQRTSTLNLGPGQTVSNLAVATLGADGSVSLSVSQGSAAVVVDVLGYLTAG